MNKENVIYPYHRNDSAIKKYIYEVLIHAAICINLENMLYEETRHKSHTLLDFSYIKCLK